MDWWLDAVAPEDWDVVISLKGEQITGVWPYVRSDRYTISMFRNPRLTPYLGPHVFFPPDVKPSNRDSYEHDVVAELLSQLPNADVWMLQPQPGMRQAGLFRNYGLNLGVHQTFIIGLTDCDENTVLSNFRDGLRRNIRTAEGELTITEEPENLPLLFEYQQKALHQKRVQQNHTLEQMHVLMTACLHNKSGTLYVARKDNVVEAILWNVWDAEKSYYFMGARKPDSEHYRGLSMLLWHCIKLACKRGNTLLDLEGSMDPGVERFFRSFGAKRDMYLVLRKDGHFLWRLRKFFKRKSR